METLKCNQVIYKEDLIQNPGFFDYIKDQLDSNVGGKILNRLMDNGESICRADTKMYQLVDINAVNIIDTVQITKLIRCKDCKWSDEEGRCEVHETLSGNDFCSKGERRKE